jgi:1-deoxy-D-xylulose-5-phosphate synthase
VALHRCGVTFVLDRAGITGEDGPSHNGMWDLSLLGLVPGLRLAAPRDGAQLRELLREAVAVDDAPTVLRFPKGAVCGDIAAVERIGPVDVLARDGAQDVLIVGVGSMSGACVEVAGKLHTEGTGVTVADPRWALPVPTELLELVDQHSLVVTVEDSGRSGGFGTALTLALRDRGVATPVVVHGVPQRFLDHDKPDAIREAIGLTPDALAHDIRRQLTG